MPSKKLPLISDVKDLRGKRVLVRAPLNAPVEDGVVTNDYRILRALPTLEHLIGEGARVVLISHIGRDPEETLKPVFDVLKKHINIEWAGGILGEEVASKVEAMGEGSVLMLENLRSNEGEKNNDEEFSKEIASYGDYYVNAAFTVSHREHASIVGVPKYLPSYAGFTFNVEYTELSKTFNPEHPSLFILGGAKFATKQPLIEKFLDLYDHIFVGGAIANDFFKAEGHSVGESVVAEEGIEIDDLMKTGKILLPTDIVVSDGNERRNAELGDTKDNEKILDAGEKTMQDMKKYIEGAKTIVWNGPLGFYEEEFVEGTHEFARMIAESDAYSVVGGGDTVAAIEELGLSEKFGFISTAGGAMLTYLESGTLPGVEAILNSKHD